MAKIKLLGKTPDELKEIAVGAGLPAFTGKQLAQWLYAKRVKSFDEMTNISKAGRERLAERYEVGVSSAVGMALSSDGTKKYLFPVSCVRSNALNAYETAADEEFESDAIEAVMIPDDDRKTLCVSSQSGCRMGCKFCMTGRQGFHGNLSAADILSQFIAVEESHELTNAVFMGMGEPLDNYDEVAKFLRLIHDEKGYNLGYRNITISTCGLIPAMKRFADLPYENRKAMGLKGRRRMETDFDKRDIVNKTVDTLNRFVIKEPCHEV